MAPSSGSGIESFSFWVPATRSGTNPVPAHTEPPSGPALSSVGTTIPTTSLTGTKRFSALPTMLLCHLSGWLFDREVLQLLLTGKAMRDEVQEMVRARLRPDVAKEAVAPLASYQDERNRLPLFSGLGREGELMFQKCMALRQDCVTQDDYLNNFDKVIWSYLPTTLANTNPLRDVTAGAVLALGGITMSEPTRNELLSRIVTFGAGPSTSAKQMGALILGVYIGLGRNKKGAAHHRAVFHTILSSHRLLTAGQLGSMICAVCVIYGGKDMSPSDRRAVVNNSLYCLKNSNNPELLKSVIHSVCLALGGKNMAPVHRAGLAQEILEFCDSNQQRPWTGPVMAGLVKGLGGTDMGCSNRDAVLAQILSGVETRRGGTVVAGICTVCIVFGGLHISPANRDAVLAHILGSFATSSPGQMGGLIIAVVSILGQARHGAMGITPANLDALIRQVLEFHDRCSARQIGEMLRGIFSTLGYTGITQARRAMLATRIRESGHVQEMAAALRLTANGQEIVDFLQLETAPD